MRVFFNRTLSINANIPTYMDPVSPPLDETGFVLFPDLMDSLFAQLVTKRLFTMTMVTVWRIQLWS